MKKNKKLLFLIGLLLLLLIIGLGVYLFVFKDSTKNNDTTISENLDDSRVIYREIDFNIDSIGYLQIVSDIILSDDLTKDEVINIELKTYDSDNNLLNSYIASSKYFDISGVSEIHLGFDDNDADNVGKVDHIESIVTIDSRDIDAVDEYDFLIIDNPTVVLYLDAYRVFMDLDDYYHNYSGLTTIEYEDDSRIIERISDIPDDTYIGITLDEDFSTRDGSNLKRVCVYKIADMWKI